MMPLFRFLFVYLIFNNSYGFSEIKNHQFLSLHSPDKKISISLKIDPSGSVSYSVKKDNSRIIGNSELGYKLKSIPDFDRGWKLRASKLRSFDNTWTAVWGPDKTIRNNYNDLKVTLIKQNKYALNIFLRAFNDGIAIRYEIPEQDSINQIEITDELTEFSFVLNSVTWSIPQNFNTDELFYRKTDLSKVKDANTPFTLQQKNYCASIHEAALIDYAQMTLVKGKDSLTMKADLVPWPDGVKVKASGKLLSPWRTIQLTNSPGELISSHLIENLNEPNTITDISWIKPGKYIGIWWEMHLGASKWFPSPNGVHGATTQNMKDYIDFASKNNIQAVLAEGWNTGWETRKNFSFTKSYPDYDLPYLAEYAHDKGVDIIVHNETASDIRNYEEQMEEAFSYYQKLGIHYVKTGYVGKMKPEGQQRHGQFMVRHYHNVIECAARHQIMLDVHEPVMGTGERRTFPNMMTREGVRGMEFEAWSEGNSPSHSTILPFTRMLAGPLDYNPGIFDILFKNSDPKKLRTIKLPNPQGIVRVHSTLAHQLALFNILYSPLQMASDLIKNYEGHPAFQFIRDSKTTWDETKVLDAKIGEYVLIARRSGNDWFIGAITNEAGRTLNLNLSFLLKGKKYVAEIYSDAADTDWKTNPTSYTISKKDVFSNSRLSLELAPGGGQAIRIHPAN